MAENTEEKSFKSILFPTDFSENSERASSYATSLGRIFKARLYVLHVVDLSLEGGGMYVPHISFDVLDKEEESQEAKSLKRFCATLSYPGEDIEPIICSGTPHSEILRVAEEKAVDIIVMGTAGERGVGRFLFGSNTESVMRNTRLPVLAIPPAI
ncbi:MAG: universal stress protein [Thermodesulfobacteriota bacterium]